MSKTRRIESDGLELAVEVFGAGPPLVFAHGLTGNRSNTRDQLAPLADHYRIVAFDQRGHGDSTPITDPALYDAERMANDIAAVMDALDIERAIVGGQSMGATTSALFALRCPGRVGTLLLTGAPFGDRDRVSADRERMREMGKVIAKHGIEVFLAHAAERQRAEKMSPEVIAYFGRMLRSHDPDSLATGCQTVVDWRVLTDLSPLADLRFPVRIIAWENDLLHPIALARRLVSLFPDARLETIPSVIHLFADPPIVGRTYRRLLEAV
ncbi:MAG: alpha/beta hydrolase [Spirochaetaceae bacterium]|nr:alpha/beta hydrolase [Spirochaetaceae bacterium]